MKNILIVDDNKFVIETLVLILASCMHDVSFRTAANGKDAVEVLANSSVDLILTDLMMPVMDGYQLIEHRNRYYPQVPLMAMTADASPNVIRKLGELGVADCLEKPFHYETISRMILNMLASGQPAPVLHGESATCR
jgi:CheY-like chemotaxis protein